MLLDAEALPDEPGYLAAATRAAPERLDSLLGDINRGRLTLPNFQRDFKWDPARMQALLVSTLARYPVGVLLLLAQAPGANVFAMRPVSGAPSLAEGQAINLILDGQQRLTSLYQALYAPDEYRFFLDLSVLLDRLGGGSAPYDAATLEDAVIFKHARVSRLRERELDSVDEQIRRLAIPLERVGANTVNAWLDLAFPVASGTDLVKRQRVQRVLDIYLTTLKAHSLPVVTLPPETPVDAVCTIFETLNQRGLKLSAFDLLTARFFKDGIHLRDLWDEALSHHSILREFDVDPYSILQAMSLRATAKESDGRTTGSAQRSDVMKLTAEEVRSHWDSVVRGMAGVLDLLRANCGVLTPDYLPYTSILVPMAAVWHVVAERKGLERTSLTEKLQRFFWCSCFSGTYDQGANSQAGRDFGLLSSWLRGGEDPPVVNRPDFTVDILDSATTRRTALYKSCMALLLRRHCRDFHRDEEVTAQRLRAREVESHHVFPRSWLRGHDSSVETELILNRTLVDGETNRTIGSSPPSQYLPKIEDRLGPETLARVLESHLLPSEVPSAVREDDYAGYIAARKSLFAEELRVVGVGTPGEPGGGAARVARVMAD